MEKTLKVLIQDWLGSLGAVILKVNQSVHVATNADDCKVFVTFDNNRAEIQISMSKVVEMTSTRTNEWV